MTTRSAGSAQIRRWLGVTLVPLALVLMSGAFIPQFIFGPQFSRDAAFLPRAINATTFIIVYLLATLVFLLGARIKWNISKLYFPIIIWILTSALSFFWSEEPLYTQYYVLSIFFLLLTSISILSTISFDDFIKYSIVIFLIIIYFSIIYIYFIPSHGIMSVIDSENSGLLGLPQGVFRHKNLLAEAASIAVIVAISGMNRSSSRSRWFPLLLILGGAYCLVASRSANKFVGLAGAVALLIAWRTLISLTASRVMTSVLLLAGAILLGFAIPYILGDILALAGKNETLSGRTIIWEHAWRLVEERPLLGYGAGSIWNTSLSYIPRFHFTPNHAHNTYIEVLLRLGLIGLIILGWLIVSISKSILYSHRSHQDPRFRFAFLMFFSVIIRSPFEVSLFQNNDITFLMLLISFGYISMPMIAVRKPTIRQTVRRSRIVYTTRTFPR